MRILLLAALAVFAASCAKAPEPPAPVVADASTKVRLAEGEAVGFITADGARSWRKLPFAAPPVGDLRWRAPRPPAPWEGVREAIEFAPRCAQMSNWLNSAEGIKPGLLLGAEDCLYLDVYAPKDASGAPYPVMVWIHGGANVWGRGTNYDGSNLANNERVIVVALQYRVGPFGYFAHPAIRDSAQTEEDRAANFATLDLIAALKWVQANASAFGGDPGRVTIFGESAGGHNVATLLASPLANGLFQRAIMESGGFDSVSRAKAEMSGGATNNSADISAKLGASDAAALRALPAEKIVRAYWSDKGPFVEVPVVIEDGVVLPSYPLRDAFASLSTFNAVPLITGTNRDEMKFFNFARPDLVKRRLFIFPVARDPQYYDALNGYMSRLWRIRSVDAPLAMMTAAGASDLYAYRFDWDDSARFFFSDFGKLIGAGHSLEIPFVFDRFQFFGARYDKIFFPQKTAESREALARAMGAYWGEFGRSGAPGAGRIGVSWPKWSDNGGSLLRLDAANDGGIGPLKGPDTIAAFIADLKADPRLDAEQRCRIVGELALFLEEKVKPIADGVGC